MNRSSPSTLFLGAATALLLAACGGSDPVDLGSRPPADSGLSIALGQSSATIARGDGLVVPIAVTRRGSFSGPVTFAVENVPLGVQWIFGLTTITADMSSNSLVLTPQGSAAAATTGITVRATAAGVDPATATFTLTVPAAPVPSVTLATAGVVNAAVEQGSATSIPIVITRAAGEIDDLSFTAEGLPAGVTAMFQFGTASRLATLNTVTLSASPTAATTTTAVPVTIRARTAGGINTTTTVNLAVRAAPTMGFDVYATPTAIRGNRGSSQVFTVELVRRPGFTAPVTLTFEGLPAGVRAESAPQPIASTPSAGAIVLIDQPAVPGSYELTIRATSPGVPERVLKVLLIVGG